MTRQFPIVTCGKHGRGPGYCVCLHVADGAKVAHLVPATEKDLGEALCKDCKKRTITADDLVLWCAGCFAESQERK